MMSKIPPSAEMIASRPFCSASSDAAASGVTSSATIRGIGGTSIDSANRGRSIAASIASDLSAASVPAARCVPSRRLWPRSAYGPRPQAAPLSPASPSCSSTSKIGLTMACWTADLRSPEAAIVAV